MPEPGQEKVKGPRFVFKFDGSMITALAALLGVLGFGGYSTITDPNDDIHTIGTGVVENSAACTELAEESKKLITLVKRKDAEIDELYETTDWLIKTSVAYGQRHPKDWRGLRRKAPVHIDLESKTASYRSEESVTAETEEVEPDDLFTEIVEDEEPKAVALPAIMQVLQRRKK